MNAHRHYEDGGHVFVDEQGRRYVCAEGFSQYLDTLPKGAPCLNRSEVTMTAGDVCVFCPSTSTGPDARTPHGICAECACPNCRGFARFDDRGFLCTGQPFLEATDCTACGGEGIRLNPRS